MRGLWVGITLTAVVCSLVTGCQNTPQANLNNQSGVKNSDPQKTGNQRRWMMAALGTRSTQIYDEVMWLVDPYNQLEDNIRNIAGIKGVYEYHLRRGDVNEATRSAAALVQYTENTYAKYEGASRSVFREQPNTRAAQALRQAYVTNKASPFSPRFLLGAATGVKDAQLLWERFTESAGAASRLPPKPSAPSPPSPLPMHCMIDMDFMLCDPM